MIAKLIVPLLTPMTPLRASALRLARAAALLLVATAGAFPRPCPAQQANEIRELFDGRTLAGWQGDANHWRVESGAIVGEIPPGTQLNKNTWLVWHDGTVRDFELRLEFKLTGAPAANS